MFLDWHRNWKSEFSFPFFLWHAHAKIHRFVFPYYWNKIHVYQFKCLYYDSFNWFNSYSIWLHSCWKERATLVNVETRPVNKGHNTVIKLISKLPLSKEIKNQIYFNKATVNAVIYFKFQEFPENKTHVPFLKFAWNFRKPVRIFEMSHISQGNTSQFLHLCIL